MTAETRVKSRGKLIDGLVKEQGMERRAGNKVLMGLERM